MIARTRTGSVAHPASRFSITGVSTRRPKPLLAPAPHHMANTPQQSAHDSVPSTIWFPTPEEIHAVPEPDSVLPEWAIDKIRTEFIPRPEGRTSPLLKLSLSDAASSTAPGTTSAQYTDPADRCHTPPGPPLILTELHPNALPTPPRNLPPEATDMLGAIGDGWPGFFHHLHRHLPAEGLLLIAAQQRRDEGILTDPLGSLIACARSAGFTYLQHILILHAHLVDEHLEPTTAPGAELGLIHSDLLVLSSHTPA